jgi:hypothetical protein
VGGPDPIQGGLDPILGVWFAHVEVLDQTWRSGPYIQGSGTFPWGSGLTGDASEYVTYCGPATAPDPSVRCTTGQSGVPGQSWCWLHTTSYFLLLLSLFLALRQTH